MNKKVLSESQKARIDEITNQWEKEREEEEKKISPLITHTFDGERTRINIRLEKKYMPLIQAIMEEG